MKFLKIGFIVLISSIVTIIVTRTFMQEPFRQTVSMSIWKDITTMAIPIYWYVIGGFISGLSIGIFIAFYNFLVATFKSSKKSKRIKHLENEVGILNDQQKPTTTEIPVQQVDEDFNKVTQQIEQVHSTQNDTIYSSDSIDEENL